MAWKTYTPSSNVRNKRPDAKIVVQGDKASLVLNQVLSKELGLSKATKYVSLKTDSERNVVGLTFHFKSDRRTIQLNYRTNPDGSVSRSVNISKFLFDTVPGTLKSKTYGVSFSREGKILVIDLNNLEVVEEA
jgi:hypothetical protein